MSVSRRRFLESAAIGSVALHPALAAEVDKKTGMPMRVLGRTGAKVSIVGLGCGSRWLMYKDEDKAAEALYKALDLGVNYLDSAFSYGNGESEARLGKFLGNRRKNVWLVTKLNKRKGDEAMEQFEGALKRMKTDRIDLVHMHSLTTEEDLASILAKDGVLNTLYKLRDQKVVRAIGVSCHTDPAVLKKLLEAADLDCTQMALNAARQGRSRGGGALKPGEDLDYTFEEMALPVAMRKKMGVTAMKVFAQDKILDRAPVEKLIRYALTLPVAAAVMGMPKLEHIEENIRIAKAFKPLPPEEMKALAQHVSGESKVAVDRFFARHLDA